MGSGDGSTVMEFDAQPCEKRRGFAPMIGLSLATAGSLLLWAVLALALRWVSYTLL